MANALTTTNPLAPNVAAEFGAIIKMIDGVYHIYNGVTQRDFDEALADLVASGVKPLNRTAKNTINNIQSEGYGRDFV